ncbi:hypothetical protein [Pseudomonas sp. SMN5]|uniref:hypothetical protein n=1 Tax=Pseudomonas sp. SMN5 TaxID=3390198 RepID=UPI003F872873
MLPDLPDSPGLRLWHDALDDKELRSRDPDLYRARLYQQSAAMAQRGVIDRLEQYDLDEMANAFYCMALEELPVD